jgi:type IX secretion system PorP/SprF family membrane protein
MRITVILCLIAAFPLESKGQYFQYSQYNFTDQRINPGMVASSNFASAAFIFRQQGTGGDIQLKSTMVSVVYPFLKRRDGKRWSGLGLSLMDDRSGGIFTVQEASLSYAINVFLNRYQFLSLGFKGLYQQRRVNLNGLYTGSQYIHDRGFDESLFSGENFGLLRSDFSTFSAGLYWQENDRQGRKIAWWGLSFFDMNNPQDSFSGIDNQMHSTFVASGGVRLYQRDNISMMPEFLLTRSSGRNVVNIGVITSYEIKPYSNQIAGRIDLITKYVPARSGIAGLQFHRGDFSIGFSYDFPVFSINPANRGAFELALQVRRLVDPATMKRMARKKTPDTPSRAGEKKAAVKTPHENRGAEDRVVTKKDSVTVNTAPEHDLRTSLREKSDSVLANAKAGRLTHEPFVIEKLILHFNFEFNSTNLDEASVRYLNDLSAALKENMHMKVKLTGHTDNIGSSGFNMRLSVYRANVVRQFLIAKGVEPSRVEAQGKGLTEPLNENKTEAERALNRRVELLIYYQQ